MTLEAAYKVLRFSKWIAYGMIGMLIFYFIIEFILGVTIGFYEDEAGQNNIACNADIIGQYIEQFPKSLIDFHPTPCERFEDKAVNDEPAIVTLAGFIFGISMIYLFIYTLGVLKVIFSALGNGDTPFVTENAIRLRRIAKRYSLHGLAQIFIIVIAAYFAPNYHIFGDGSLLRHTPSFQFGFWFFTLIFWVLSAVFSIGIHLQQEQDLTV